MKKFEYKYLVDENLLDRLRRALEPYVIWDRYSEIRPEKHYTVKSIYFDTNRLDFYQEKLSGLKRRKKIRIRGYNDEAPDATVFLEIKRKNGQIISKNRASLLFKNLKETSLNNGVEEYLIRSSDDENLRHGKSFLFYLRSLNLIPTIKIFYEREAHFARMNPDLRLTIDRNLRSSLQVGFDTFFEDLNMRNALPNKSILEIKSRGGFPLWLQQLIGRAGLHLQALSKYTICMESHTRYEHQLQRSIHGYRKFDAFKYQTKITGQ